MIQHTLSQLNKHVRKRIWIFSDLQLRDPDQLTKVLDTAVTDFERLNMPCDQIWYLGDALIGMDESLLLETARIQIELLRPLNVPLRFVNGNHDLDYIRGQSKENPNVVSFFQEAVRQVPGWKTTDKITSPYFIEEFGEFNLLFLSDHADSNGAWMTNGRIIGNDYPYDEAFFDQLKDEISASDKPVIIASHYAFAGGNRPSELWNRLLPLPDQVKVVFYGHSHIGDAHWGKENIYRKIACVDYQSIPQINVSSLENVRGDKIRSVILEIYEDRTLGIYFREHERKEWTDMLLLPTNLLPTR